MLLQIFGSIGIGLVWGWLLGLLFPPTRPFRPINWKKLIGAGTGFISLASVILAFLSWPYTLIFLGAAILSFLVHRTWLANLQHRTMNQV